MAIKAHGINISNCGIGIMLVGGKIYAEDVKFNNCGIDVVLVKSGEYDSDSEKPKLNYNSGNSKYKAI
jgi:hypothetical protein